jgi:hypothetical protein
LENMAIRERLRKKGLTKASKSALSESFVRRRTREEKILSEPTPPSFVIKDTSHLRTPPRMGPALDQVPQERAISKTTIHLYAMIILRIADDWLGL